jgi:hypothetical protein
VDMQLTRLSAALTLMEQFAWAHLD